MRIVLDTNVVVSAMLWRGAPYRLFHALSTRERTFLFSSIALLDEFSEVLTRPVPAKRLAIIGLSALRVLADYVDAIELVTPQTTPAVIAADPDDDHVLAAAVAAGADVIVSGDRHLLALAFHQGIRIANPADALSIIIP